MADPIVVRCSCGKFYNVPADKAGKRFKCTGCGNSLLVEAPVPEEAAAAPEPEPEPEPAPAPKAAPPRPGARTARPASSSSTRVRPAPAEKTGPSTVKVALMVGVP